MYMYITRTHTYIYTYVCIYIYILLLLLLLLLLRTGLCRVRRASSIRIQVKQRAGQRGLPQGEDRPSADVKKPPAHSQDVTGSRHPSAGPKHTRGRG